MKEEKTEYIPKRQDHRKRLAKDILELLAYAKFVEQESKGEKIFARQVNDDVRVVVYTSIVGDEVREKDADAIRVCGVYTNKDGNEHGIVKSSRIYRTGNLEDISERLLKRMREVWRKTMHVDRCHCGAPKFISKKENAVCCNFCWKQ